MGRSKKYTSDQINEIFEELLSMMKEGLTISDSLKALNLDRSTFYNYITEEQKKRLEIASLLNTQYGYGSRFPNG